MTLPLPLTLPLPPTLPLPLPGMMNETRGALEAAEAFGYIEGHKVEVALIALDELLAVLYRLAMPRS